MMDLPALTLTDDGRIIAPDTGEVLDEAAAGNALAETLRTYARAKVEADALAMRRSDYREALIDQLRHDPVYQGLAEQQDAALATMAAIEATLAAMFAQRDGKVSIETPDALVTWSKPRETWSLAHPAGWYATEVACQDLARRLRDRWDASLGHQEALRLAVLVRDWLAPTAKVSEPSGPSITVRANGGGR